MAAAGVLRPLPQAMSAWEPFVLGGREWRRRPGGEQALRLFALARPQRQQKVYDRWVGFWEDFCAVGDGLPHGEGATVRPPTLPIGSGPVVGGLARV